MRQREKVKMKDETKLDRAAIEIVRRVHKELYGIRILLQAQSETGYFLLA